LHLLSVKGDAKSPLPNHRTELTPSRIKNAKNRTLFSNKEKARLTTSNANGVFYLLSNRPLMSVSISSSSLVSLPLGTQHSLNLLRFLLLCYLFVSASLRSIPTSVFFTIRTATFWLLRMLNTYIILPFLDSLEFGRKFITMKQPTFQIPFTLLIFCR